MFSKLIRKFNNFIHIPLTFRNWPRVILYVASILLRGNAYRNSIGTVILRNGQSLKIRLANTLDLGSVMETNQRKVYTPPFIQIPENAKIIDVGASIGDFSIFCATYYKNAAVFCYEPMSEAFELLLENVRSNKLEGHIKPYNLAVSDKEGTIKFGDVIYKAISFRQIFEQNKIDKCDLLKMDIEGAEYTVLLNCPADVLKTINAITMECHYFDTNNDLDNLVRYLSETGFNVKTTSMNVHKICYLYATR